MAPPTISYYGAGTASTQTVLAGLDGGYFLTDGGAADRLALFNVAAPDTALDTYTIESSRRWLVHNSNGSIYAFGSATTTDYYLAEITVAAETISAGTVGSFTHGLSVGASWASLSYDASELMIYSGTSADRFIVVSTADASIIGDTTMTGDSNNAWALAAAGAGRVVCTNKIVGPRFELWDSATDTLLDTLAMTYEPAGVNPSVVIPVGNERLFFCIGEESSDPINLWIGVLDTTGDALAYEWEAVIATPWDGSNTLMALADVRGDFAFIAPRDPFSDDPSTLYAVDINAATVQASSGLSNVSPGAELLGPFFCGPDFAVWTEGSSPFRVRMWALAYTTGPRLLRQRQSPKRTPSRVRGVDLRQRQTPFI